MKQAGNKRKIPYLMELKPTLRTGKPRKVGIIAEEL